jgi:hypothetical protein
MSKQPQVFPFKANRTLANDIWRSWSNKNREMLDRDYGSVGFVGDDTAKKHAAAGWGIYTGYGHIQSFSCYEVDMIIRSETEITFEAYGMADAVYGGRTHFPQNTFEVTVKPKAIAEEIHKRKMRIAEFEYDERLRVAAEEARKRAIQAVFNELFTETV